MLLFVALVPILRRVTQRIRRQMAEIEHRAHYDALTGLPNRTLFRSLVEREPHRRGPPAAVLLLDVDRFKEVNDALGHERGDRLLQGARHAAGRRPARENVVARLGGDEFAVLLPERTPAETRRVAGRSTQRWSALRSWTAFTLEVAASIGVAVLPGARHESTR